jgi:hypothetical protein
LCIFPVLPTDNSSQGGKASLTFLDPTRLLEALSAMKEIACLPTLNELRRHVLLILCRNDQLDVSQTPLQQAVITRRGKPCGLFFQVQGPRLLKNYAVWAGAENRILFYNGAGDRIAETRLTAGPDPRGLA